MGNYHNLEVWKLGCALADEIAIVIDEEVPGGLESEMGDQLARSSNSIARNIAEGCGYNSDRQLLKYLRQAMDRRTKYRPISRRFSGGAC